MGGIELGLARITELLRKTPQTWKAIHVAGTNGKGTICAYLTAMLRANQIPCGRFTSPHLVDRWDCITIDDMVISESKFHCFEDLVRRRDEHMRLGASGFECLTATAFEVFEAEKVDVGVVEVGLGGRLDATNALKHKMVTVVSKIGLDHQAFLGNTLEEVALQKAGIMEPGVPCVVDASNSESVLEVMERHAARAGTNIVLATPGNQKCATTIWEQLEPHQAQNLSVAHEAFRVAYGPLAERTDLGELIRNMSWPGRLQLLDMEPLTGQQGNILLDGAHNIQSAQTLAAYVQKYLRGGGEGISWILAASKGKNINEILATLLRPGDSVAAVEFGPVDGMPWVNPVESLAILRAAHQLGIASSSQYDAGINLRAALDWASQQAPTQSLVAAGSLYLVSDIMKLPNARKRREGTSA